MGKMFYGCSSLTNLNLSSFNIKNDSDMGNMFLGCRVEIISNCSNKNVINHFKKLNKIDQGIQLMILKLN